MSKIVIGNNPSQALFPLPPLLREPGNEVELANAKRCLVYLQEFLLSFFPVQSREREHE